MLPRTKQEGNVAEKKKLTIRVVEETQPSTRDVTVWDNELTGFGLKVTPKGKKTFFLQYRTLDHVERKPKIADYPATKPEKARELAKDMLTEVRKGNDPSQMRQAKRASRGEGAVSDHFDDYLKFKKKGGLRSVKEIERIFKHDVLPVLGKRKAEEVTSLDVTKLLDSIGERSVSVAGATSRQLSAFYKWAMPRLPVGSTNPLTNASRPPSLKARDRVLTDAELKKLWVVLENESDLWRTALRLMILTGQRREEILAAEWDEFDLGKRVWIIPGQRAKNGKPHIVPLSPAVLALLKSLPSRTGRLFPVGTGLTSRAAIRIREAMGAGVPAWRWHDLRRTMATGLQRLGVRLEVTEAVLNHVSGSRAGIVGVYQRHDWADEKREALDSWAREVARIVGKRHEGKRKSR
jgi:integrase